MGTDYLDSIIVLGKLSRSLFPVTHTLPKFAGAGDVFYAVGFLVGLILWGFSIVWFFVAVVMIATSGGFPFNMGWWGFIFPVGKQTFAVRLCPVSQARDLPHLGRSGYLG